VEYHSGGGWSNVVYKTRLNQTINDEEAHSFGIHLYGRSGDGCTPQVLMDAAVTAIMFR
jgi:hypothetical protein